MRRTRPQHPHSSVPGPRPSDRRADGPAPRPRSHFSTARGTRLRRASRASRLPAGRVGEQRCRRPRPGAQKRPHPSHLLTPAVLRPPPPASGQRGRRASCPAGRQTCNLPPRAAPQVVRRSQRLAKIWGRAVPDPESRPPAGKGESGPPRTSTSSTPAAARATAARAPPRLRPSPAPAPAAAGRKGREEMPGSASASCGAVPPLSGRGGPRSPPQRPPLRSARIWWGKQ